jgi:hypothetical protein
MDSSNLAEHVLWPDFSIAESQPEHLNWDSLVDHGALQPDWWTCNGTDTSEIDEVCSNANSISAAELGRNFISQWSDSSVKNDHSIQSSVQSSLASSSREQLAKDLSKNPSSTERFTRAKSYPRLSLDAVKALRLWLHQHQNFPYPTPDERAQLEQQTGLNKIQVLNWFANARRRRRKRMEHDSTAGESLGAGTSLSPLERWKQSPPESEPAATSDIMRALENMHHYPDQGQAYYSDSGRLSVNSSGSSGSSFLFGAPSMSVFENSCSSGSDLAITPIHRQAQRPPTPNPSMGKRHQRRKNSRLAGQLEKPKIQGSRMFQCTFCCDSFRTKYEWTRHEKAIHISVDLWRCAPEGGIIEADGFNICVFCQAQNADGNHLETHNFLQCQDKPSTLREFSRKDHLRQHLRLMHNVQDHHFLDKWRVSLLNLHSRCGFCNSTFTTWDERADHLAEHFKTGADMSQWTGNWGFDPDIELQVRNAMPAWLLGQERTTVDPMKMSDATQPHDQLSSMDNFPKGVDLYMILRNGLVSYIQDQISTGLYPSDEMIQSTARLMMYGSDDPWNQTFAENSTWLAALKHDVHFGSSKTLPGRHTTSKESSIWPKDC